MHVAPERQTWSQRINLGVLRVVCYFHRSRLWGPFLGAVGTSSHKDPSVAAASSAGEGDPLAQGPGHGGRLSQHSLGPGSWWQRLSLYGLKIGDYCIPGSSFSIQDKAASISCTRFPQDWSEDLLTIPRGVLSSGPRFLDRSETGESPRG